MKLVLGIALSSLFGLMASPLQAQGILMVQTEVSAGKNTMNQFQIDKNYMRVEFGGSQTAMVFDGPKQVMRMMDLTKKTYMEITRSDLEQAKKQMDAMMAQMQNMSPAQRQQMEKQMEVVNQALQGRGVSGVPGMPGMPGMTPPKTEYRAAGSDKVGSWACTKYEGFVNNQKTVEVCAANPSVLSLVAADFEFGKQMSEFAKTIQPGAIDQLVFNATTQDQGYNGIPLRQTTFKNGAVVKMIEITQLKRVAFPASTFDVPAGFTKTANPMSRGGAR